MRQSALAWKAGQPIPAELRTRFWAKVRKTDTCWYWEGKRFGVTDYGAFNMCVQSWRGPAWRPESAHRVAMELTTGRPIPSGLHVLHSCDIRWCVRPDHLRLGTDADNKSDVIARRRMPRGTLHHNAKLSERQVLLLRKAYAKGTTMAVLATRAGVDLGTLWSLLKGRTWHHVGGPILSDRRLNCRVNDEQVLDIRRRHAVGESLNRLAKAFGLSKHGVWAIVQRKTWRHLP